MLKAKLQSLEDMPRQDARGRGRGQLFEAEAEDKISASRTVWPRGLNITAYSLLYTVQCSVAYTIDPCTTT